MMQGDHKREQAAQEPQVLSHNPADDERGEIDLIELFYHLLEKGVYIIAATLLGAIVAGLVTFLLLTPQYEATSKLYVLNSNDSVVNLSDLQIGSYLATDYQEVFKTWEVNEKVIQALNLPYTYDELLKKLTITNPSNSRILYITVRTDDAKEAARIANEYASVVRAYIAETMATEAPNILSTALENHTPVSPSKARNLLLGALLGALLAAGIIVVRFMLDDKIRSAEDVTKYTGLPTLAIVPLMGQNIVPLDRSTHKKASGKGRSPR